MAALRTAQMHGEAHYDAQDTQQPSRHPCHTTYITSTYTLRSRTRILRVQLTPVPTGAPEVTNPGIPAVFLHGQTSLLEWPSGHSYKSSLTGCFHAAPNPFGTTHQRSRSLFSRLYISWQSRSGNRPLKPGLPPSVSSMGRLRHCTKPGLVGRLKSTTTD